MSDEKLFYLIGEPVVRSVSEDWVHDRCLETFQKRTSAQRDFFMHTDISATKYPSASTRLVPGARVQIQMVGLHSGTNIRISQCVTFLISEGAALTSVHGLVFAYETAPELFESGYTYVSLDVRDMMHRDLEDKERRLRHPYLNIPHERFNREKRIGHALIEKYGPLTRLLLMKVLAS